MTDEQTDETTDTETTEEEVPTVHIMLDDTGEMGDVPFVDPSKINDPQLRHAVWQQSEEGQAHIRAMFDAKDRDLTLEALEAEVAANKPGDTIDGLPSVSAPIPAPGTDPADQAPQAPTEPQSVPSAPAGMPAGFGPAAS